MSNRRPFKLAANAMTDKPLTPKQKRFAQEYILDLNATQAAIRAGYSENTAQQIGSENLSKPVIQEKIDELQKVIADKAGVDAEYVLNGLKELHEVCMGRKAIVLTKDGHELDVTVFEHSGASKSLELLGKHLKLFTEKVEHSGNIQLERLSDDDLENKLRQLEDE